jgi:hypothetical protein
MRSHEPTRWDIGMTGEGPAVRGHSLASGRKGGHRPAALDWDSADLKVDCGREVAQLYGGRLVLVAADRDERMLHSAVESQLHAPG